MPCVYNVISTESEVQIPNMSCQFKESFDAALPWHCIVGKKWDPGIPGILDPNEKKVLT